MISNFFLYPTVLKEELTAERRSVLAMEDLIVECHTKGVRSLLMSAFGSEELEYQCFTRRRYPRRTLPLVPPGTFCRIPYTTKGLRHDQYEETLHGLRL